MENDGIKAMSNILDNSKNISKEIRNEVYKLLGLNTQSEQLAEYVNECLENFDFNSKEMLFLEQLRRITNEEINIINEQKKSNEQVDYERLESKLIERFKASERPIINIDDNIRELANQIVNKFPQINVSSEQLYNHFVGKKEQMIELINRYNKEIVDALIKITPQLAENLKISSNTINKQNTASIFPKTSTFENAHGVQNNQAVDLQQLHSKQQAVNYLSLNDFHNKCINMLTDVDIMFKNGGNGKSEIAKVSRQLKNFIDSLDNRVYAESLLEKYKKVSDYAISMIYDQIIFENVPMLKEIYEKYQDLFNDTNTRKNNKPIDPNVPTPTNTYIGASNEEIRDLINKENYYSILHGIGKEDVAKYSNFINNGYQMVINDYLAKAREAKTFEEKHNSYFELYEIYQNFRDYLPPDQVNQLSEQLDCMHKYLNEQRKNSIDDSSIRYNSEKIEKASAMHR